MATKTSTEVAGTGLLPKALHSGVQSVTGTFTSSATMSVSDTIQMVLIPHGARVLDVHVSGHIDVAAATIKVGDGGDDDRYGSVSLSVTASYVRTNASTGHNFKYSLSDDATTRYDTIDITVAVAASATVSASLVLTCFYHMD